MEGFRLDKNKIREIAKDTQQIFYPKRVGGIGYTLDFGKYAGWKLEQVARKNPEYIRWLADSKAIVLEPEFLSQLFFYCIYYLWNEERYSEFKAEAKFREALGYASNLINRMNLKPGLKRLVLERLDKH